MYIIAGDRDPAFQLVGRGADEISRGLEALEPLTTTSVWNIQAAFPFQLESVNRRLDERSTQRGVQMQLIVPPSALRKNPLATSMYPTIRVAPVFGPLLLLDASLTVVSGGRTGDGDYTAWVTDDAELVGLARDIWDRTHAISHPALPSGRPPLSPRQVEAARLVATGATDDRIGRQLHVSPRTVVADIRAVCALLGAGTRAEMAAKLVRHSV